VNGVITLVSGGGGSGPIWGKEVCRAGRGGKRVAIWTGAGWGDDGKVKGERGRGRTCDSHDMEYGGGGAVDDVKVIGRVSISVSTVTVE
jgi:hypothetical protein